MIDKIKMYLNKKVYRYKPAVLQFIRERELDKKFPTIMLYFGNVLLTGTIIWYILKFHNFLSYGLTSALVMYYISWLIAEIKKKG